VIVEMSTAPAAMSFASFAVRVERGRRDVDRALDRRVDHLADKNEGDRQQEGDQLEAADTEQRGGDDHGNCNCKVDAEVPLCPKDVDDPFERVVEAVEQRRRATRCGRR